MKRESYETGVHAGSALLIVLSLLVCLSVLSVLSLSSARADLTLSERACTGALEYYGADSRAQEIFSRIDPLLREKNTDEAALQKIEPSVRCDRDLVFFAVPMPRSRSLVVVLQKNPQPHILSYRVIHTDGGDYDTQPELWDGTVSVGKGGN